jgi:serine/threonine protein kinase
VNTFQAKIAMTANLRHNHLLSLVGYCKENDEMILIYNYMAHGTLRGRLYGNNTEETPLTWRQRLDVCIGAARALQYLHECSIIHCDMTTMNILLDERLVAKVSHAISPRQDYKDVSACCMRTCGYFDPEFYLTMQLTEKSDVYSFGVVLFEVLCARAVLDPTLPSKQVNLVECALNCKKKGILDLVVDPCLEGKIAPWCLTMFVDIAEKCVANDRVDRPSMREVLQNLEMCLANASGGIGDKMSDDDSTNGPSKGEHRLNLEMYLSEESEGYDSEIWISEDDGVDGDAQVDGSMDSG